MKSKILIKEALVRLSARIGLILLMFQINGCELEVIPPTDPEASLNTRSNFQFTIQDPECASNCTVTFTNLSQNADTYQWDFGDATASSAVANPSHIYVNPGSYDVKLTASRGTVKHDKEDEQKDQQPILVPERHIAAIYVGVISAEK